MPYYDFMCEKEGKIELKMKMSEVKEVIECPNCGAQATMIFSPTVDIWKTDGNFGRGDNKSM